MRPQDHIGAEGPGGRGPEYVQSGNGTLQSWIQARRTSGAAQGPQDVAPPKRIAGDFYTVARPQKDVIDTPLAPIVETNRETAAGLHYVSNLAPHRNLHVAEARAHPVRGIGAARPTSEPSLEAP